MATSIDKNANTIALKRPDWLTDDSEWGRINNAVVDYWSTLLDAAARGIASQQRRAAGDR